MGGSTFRADRGISGNGSVVRRKGSGSDGQASVTGNNSGSSTISGFTSASVE